MHRVHTLRTCSSQQSLIMTGSSMCSCYVNMVHYGSLVKCCYASCTPESYDMHVMHCKSHDSSCRSRRQSPHRKLAPKHMLHKDHAMPDTHPPSHFPLNPVAVPAGQRLKVSLPAVEV